MQQPLQPNPTWMDMSTNRRHNGSLNVMYGLSSASLPPSLGASRTKHSRSVQGYCVRRSLHIKDVWAMRVLARKAGFQQQDLSMCELSISRRSGYLISASRNILQRYIPRSTMLSSGRHCDDPMPLGALSGETRRVHGWD